MIIKSVNKKEKKKSSIDSALLFYGLYVSLLIYFSYKPARRRWNNHNRRCGQDSSSWVFSFHASRGICKSCCKNRIFSLYGFTDQSFSKYGLGQSLLDIPITKAFRRARFAVDNHSRFFNTLVVYSPADLIAAAVNFLLLAVTFFGFYIAFK